MTDESPSAPYEPKPAVYMDINEVPEVRRTVYGARIDVQQANYIDALAYEMGRWHVDQDGNPTHFEPLYGHARARFVEMNEVVNGVWRAKREPDA